MVGQRKQKIFNEIRVEINEREEEMVEIKMIKNEDKFMDMEGEDMRRSILMKENEKGERI